MFMLWLRRAVLTLAICLIVTSPFCTGRNLAMLHLWQVAAGLAVGAVLTLALEVSKLFEAKWKDDNIVIVLGLATVLAAAVLYDTLNKQVEIALAAALTATAAIIAARYARAMLSAWHPLGLRP